MTWAGFPGGASTLQGANPGTGYSSPRVRAQSPLGRSLQSNPSKDSCIDQSSGDRRDLDIPKNVHHKSSSKVISHTWIQINKKTNRLHQISVQLTEATKILFQDSQFIPVTFTKTDKLHLGCSRRSANSQLKSWRKTEQEKKAAPFPEQLSPENLWRIPVMTVTQAVATLPARYARVFGPR